MSELKATTSGEIRARDVLLGYWWYEKSEADKVIAHQKYKRCLDNAWQCKKLSYVYTVNACNHRGWNIERYYDKKAELYRKWHKRWLELAGQFKETK